MLTIEEKIEQIKDNLDVRVDNATWAYIAIQELLAELDNQKATVTMWQAEAVAQKKETERLRKALESIRREFNLPERIAEIARKALEGKE